jgi:hypothetical protein
MCFFEERKSPNPIQRSRTIWHDMNGTTFVNVKEKVRCDPTLDGLTILSDDQLRTFVGLKIEINSD